MRRDKKKDTSRERDGDIHTLTHTQRERHGKRETDRHTERETER